MEIHVVGKKTGNQQKQRKPLSAVQGWQDACRAAAAGGQSCPDSGMDGLRREGHLMKMNNHCQDTPTPKSALTQNSHSQ